MCAAVEVAVGCKDRIGSSAWGDTRHKTSSAAGPGVALMIWLSAVFAAVESYRKLIDHRGTTHLALGWPALYSASSATRS